MFLRPGIFFFHFRHICSFLSGNANRLLDFQTMRSIVKIALICLVDLGSSSAPRESELMKPKTVDRHASTDSDDTSAVTLKGALQRATNKRRKLSKRLSRSDSASSVSSLEGIKFTVSGTRRDFISGDSFIRRESPSPTKARAHSSDSRRGLASSKSVKRISRDSSISSTNSGDVVDLAKQGAKPPNSPESSRESAMISANTFGTSRSRISIERIPKIAANSRDATIVAIVEILVLDPTKTPHQIIGAVEHVLGAKKVPFDRQALRYDFDIAVQELKDQTAWLEERDGEEKTDVYRGFSAKFGKRSMNERTFSELWDKTMNPTEKRFRILRSVSRSNPGIQENKLLAMVQTEYRKLGLTVDQTSLRELKMRLDKERL
jgi:hypothetical protein